MRIVTNCVNSLELINKFFNKPDTVITVSSLEDLLKVDIEGLSQPATAVVLDAHSEDFLSLMLFVASGATLTCPVYVLVNDHFIPVPSPYESDVWIPILRGTLNGLIASVKYFLKNHDASDKILKEEFEDVFKKVEDLKQLFYERVKEEVKDATDKLL